MYSRMDQVKFVKDSLLISFTWSILEYIASNISNTGHSDVLTILHLHHHRYLLGSADIL